MSQVTEWPYESCERCGRAMMAEIKSTEDGSTMRTWCPKCTQPTRLAERMKKYIHDATPQITAADLTVRQDANLSEPMLAAADAALEAVIEHEGPFVGVRYDDLSMALAIIADAESDLNLNDFERAVIARLRQAIT